MAITKDALLAKLKTSLRTEEVFIPELGDKVMIRELTGAERDAMAVIQMEAGKNKAAGLTKSRIYILSVAMLDPAGTPIFTSEELQKHYRCNGSWLVNISNKISAMSGISDESREEIGKN